MKVNAICFLTRNLSTKEGAPNNSKIIVREMHRYMIIGETCPEGRRVAVPRIRLKFRLNREAFTVGRVQFPLRLAYACTINRS